MKNNLFVNTLNEILSGKGNPTSGNTKTAKDVEPQLTEFFIKGHHLGEPTYIPALNDYLRWKNGFLYTVSGYPGAGKSTFINYLLLLKAVNDGKKIAIYSPESYPVEDMIEEIIIQHVGKNVADNFGNQMSLEELKQSVEFLSAHFFLLEFDDIPTQEDVFNEFQRLVDSEGVEICVIDPFNSLVEGANMGGGGNISVYLKGALTRAKLFAVKNNVSLVIIEHPRSSGANKSEERPEPSPFMISGGPMYWNKSDVVFTVNRDMFDSTNPMVTIKVWKVKKQRLMGKPGEVDLTFDFKTGRYE